MQHRFFLFSLSLLIVCTATTAVWAVVLPFNTTAEMTLTPGGGYTNSINVYVASSGLNGDEDTTTSGKYQLQLSGNVDTVAETVNLTGMGFIKRDSTGQISADDFTIQLASVFLVVDFSGLKADLDSPSSIRPVDVTGGTSYSTGGSSFWMNGGGYEVVAVPGGVQQSKSFGTGPESAALAAQTGSLTIDSVSIVDNNLHFSVTQTVPISTDTTHDGTQTKVNGTLRSVGEFVASVPEPGTIAMLLSLAASLAGYGFWRRRD